jgi:hypothetical protein
MSNITSTNRVINSEYTITITPSSPLSGLANCFCRVISIVFNLKNRHTNPQTVIMRYNKTEPQREVFPFQNKTVNSTPAVSNEDDSDEHVYWTIGEMQEHMKYDVGQVQEDIKDDNHTNKTENGYIVMRDLSGQRLQQDSQNQQIDHPIKESECEYCEMLSPYMNLRSLKTQDTTSNKNIESLTNEYIDDQNIYENIH